MKIIKLVSQSRSLLSLADDPDYGDYTDINEGIDFTLEAKYGDVGGRQVLLSSITPKRKSSPLSTDADLVKSWLENQNEILELQGKYKKSYDTIKKLLAKFINPEAEAEEGEIIKRVNHHLLHHQIKHQIYLQEL